MNKVKIVADSTCDLSEDLIKAHDITVIPLCIVMHEKSYYDGIEITPDEIYSWADANRSTPKTAAASFDKTIEILKPYFDEGREIIFIGISSKMSTTCNVIRLVAEQNNYDKLYVIDSLNLSTGIGLQVLRAAELSEEGLNASEIVKRIEGARDKVQASFVVDTLTYLSRGGRCTAVTALMANAFKIHPMIAVKDGAMGVSRKYRGKPPVAITNYVSELIPQLKNADKKRVFITHSGCDKSIIEAVYDMIRELNLFEEILVTRAGGVISSHCGPGTLGVLFYSEN